MSDDPDDPEVVRRRIASLRLLVRMDPANTPKYEAQIAALGGEPGPAPPAAITPPAPTGRPVLPPFPTAPVTPLTERPIRVGTGCRHGATDPHHAADHCQGKGSRP